MQFRKFKQNKLWRDKIIDFLEKDGSKIHWKKLTDKEFSDELQRKFLEEAHEVADAKNKEELIEELADILEVMTSLADVHAFTLQDVINAQEKKREKKGGFKERKFITVAEHQVGSLGEQYCLARPEKYPEIIE